MLKKLIEAPTSPDQVAGLLDWRCNVIIGDEILKYSTIDQVLGRHDRAYIMYMQTPTYGHWCAIARYGQYIQVYDPYGDYIDDYNKEFKTNIRDHLSKLLLAAPEDVLYNDFKFQSDISAVCGLWCALFLMYGREMHIDDFIAKFQPMTEADLVSIFYDL
jgi:hypothetical protein